MNQIKFYHGYNLDLYFLWFIKHSKLTTNDDSNFMHQNTHFYFITSIFIEIMKKVGIHSFIFDNAMLCYLKFCIQFFDPTPIRPLKLKVVTMVDALAYAHSCHFFINTTNNFYKDE